MVGDSLLTLRESGQATLALLGGIFGFGFGILVGLAIMYHGHGYASRSWDCPGTVIVQPRSTFMGPMKAYGPCREVEERNG